MPETPDHPDQATQLVERIAADLASIRWASPTEIRNRARRRARRQAASGALALMVVVAAASAVGSVVRPDRTPSPVAATPVPTTPDTVPPVPPEGAPAQPVPSPRSSVWPDPTVQGAAPTTPFARTTVSTVPTAIPVDALLQPGDLGADLLLGATETTDFAPVRPIADSLVSCPDYATLDRYDGVAVAFRRHALLRDPADGDPVLRQEVGRFPGGAAGRIVDDVDRAVAVCARYRSPGPTYERRLLDGWGEHAWSRVDRGFAGDQSMLLRHEIARQGSPGSVVYLVAVIRVGDLVTVVTSADLTGERAREMAATAAARLCRTANPGC
ncbi:hypothetical protein [Micromonospora echinofusca]|uniref:PknH-like extracellular domain-containing protein n=1 Tax=Micromonospora echinofusca TaxID=47858 RepID=A0ABS3VPR4_MICEH|nr:hypothetical protein [Micromonospora echinofusca]MBO4206497.1 hypothetical protein [Micromonospora echinofusca]